MLTFPPLYSLMLHQQSAQFVGYRKRRLHGPDHPGTLVSADNLVADLRA